jgi:Family of unknown function (DUF5906)
VNLAELTGLHADIDFKGVGASEAEILAALEALPLRPSRVNHSGHGVHAYWLFKKALAANEDNMARLEAALKRLAIVVAGDPSVCEAARLMRLPGSHNSKDGDWLEVTNLVRREGGYRLKELETWLATAPPVLTPLDGQCWHHESSDPWLALAAAQIIQAPIDVEARLAAMVFHGPGETAVHLTQLSVTAALLNRGVPIDGVVARVLDGTRRAVGVVSERWNWRSEERKLRYLCETWVAKHPEIVADVVTTAEAEPEDDAELTVESEVKPPSTPPKPAKAATDNLAAAKLAEQGAAGVSLADLHAYLVQHKYIFAPTGDLWPAESIDSIIPQIPLVNRKGAPVLDARGKQKTICASLWLDRNKPIAQLTWAPGFPVIVRDRLVSDGGWVKRKRTAVFNFYKPPPELAPGDPAKAGPWLDHVHKLFPDDADHVIQWLACRVQFPAEKINHALVLGSEDQGIGKDTLLEPVKRGIGHWNFAEASAQQLLGRFTASFLKSVILRVSEARDLGEFDRFAFYDHMKTILAAPPDVLRVDEKHIKAYTIFNCVGVIITTNHKSDGVYLPADDRRHFVAWSDCRRMDFEDGYWNRLWGWYDSGGDRLVVAYLKALDLSAFDPKAPPPKTEAFWAIVGANHAPEAAELADIIDRLDNPNVATLELLRDEAIGDIEEWLRDRRNRRILPHRMESCGYVPIRNRDSDDGLWVVNGRRQVVYVKKTLPLLERIKFARAFAAANRAPKAPPRKDVH